MARTLKTTGIAANCLLCVAVDDDNTTIREFKESRTLNIIGSVTSPAETTWRSSSNVPLMRFGNDSSLQLTGTPRLALNLTTGVTIVAFVVSGTDNDNFSAVSLVGGDYNSASHDWLFGWWASTAGDEDLFLRVAASNTRVQSTWVAPKSTAWMGALHYKTNTASNGYGLRYAPASSATITQSLDATSSSLYNSVDVYAVGGVHHDGVPTYRRCFEGDMLMLAIFSGRMSDSDLQTLHGDPFGTMFESGGAAVTVSAVEDDLIYNGETGVVIDGANFGTSQGTGSVKICPTNNVNDANAVTQTVTAWTTGTSITFTAVRGSLAANTNLYLFVTNGSGVSNSSGHVLQFSATTKLKLVAHSSAVGASSISGVVFSAPTGGAITGTEIGEFTGQDFVAGQGADAGYAVLWVDLADILPDGTTLNVGATPVAIARNATYTTGIVACTVVEVNE